MKIGYLNLNDMKVGLHSEYVNADKNLMNLDVLCLSDTRLTKERRTEEVKVSLPNWEVIYRDDCADGREHMGMLFLVPVAKAFQKKLKLFKFIGTESIKGKIKKPNERVQVQVVHCKYSEERISFLYARTTPSIKEAKEIYEITKTSSYLLGDLNLCGTEESDEQKLKIICGKDKIRHLNQITTVRGNQPDHIIVAKDRKHTVYSDSFFNYASDHKGIILRISHYANDEVIEDMSGTDHIIIEPSPEEIQKVPQTKLNQEPLEGTNWLDDIIINEYCSLLMQKFSDIFVYSTYFSQSFFTLNRDYENVKRYSKSTDIFKCRIVMFPLLELSHWFLAVYEVEDNKLYIMDPYTQNQSHDHIFNEHMQRLKKIETYFLQKHFESEKQDKWVNALLSVKMPPAIPEQLDGHNCGVFLLEFAR